MNVKHSVKILLVGGLSSVVLGGCSIQKRCLPPQLDLPERVIPTAADSLTAADMGWWELYSDTVLLRLIARTLENNRNMQAAETNIRRMEELYRISRAAQLPTLDAKVSGDYETKDYYEGKTSQNPKFSAKATLSWEVDLWGNLRWARRQGAADYLGSVEAARAMQMTLVAEAATAYFELIALDQELEIVRRTVQIRHENVRQAKLRFEGGLTSETAYQQAQVELANASALIPGLERQVALKENQIAVLSGRYPTRIERGVLNTEIRLPDSLAVGLPSTLLQRRPDVRQAEQKLKSSMAAVGMAYADRFPRLTISLTGGLENDDLQGLLRSPFSYVVGNLASPLFSFGKKQAVYRAALAAYDGDRLAYEQKVLEVFREVNDAVVTYDKAREAARLKADLRDASRKYVELAHLQYINGVIRYIDVLDAQRSLFDAEIGLSKAVLGEYLAMVNLYKALGGGWGFERVTPQGLVSGGPREVKRAQKMQNR